VFFRLIVEGTGADWPLSRKFGAHAEVIQSLIYASKDLGLVPYGLSFHVGSQQHDIGQWNDAISRCKHLFDLALERGIQLKMLNLGGGFPAKYKQSIASLDTYAQSIHRFLNESFGDEMPEIYLEPGRSIAGESGVLVSEVVSISKKSESNLNRWVYLDVGLFNGLIETLGEAIKYPIYFDREGGAEEKVIIAGPTCDSIDILYEDYKYKMPASVQPGDRVYIFSTGAYTQSYSSVAFNGFPPLKYFLLPDLQIDSLQKQTICSAHC